MKKIFAILTIMMAFSSAIAQDDASFGIPADSVSSGYTKALADSAYSAGDYTTAADIYEHILADGESSIIYYNLGNAYFKSEEIARAILNYERALLLDPSNKDIRFNLELARSKMVDRVSEDTEIFIVRWFHNFANLLSLNEWAILAILLFLLTIGSIIAFIFSKKHGIKKLFFTFAAIFLLMTICANIIGQNQKKRLVSRNSAIVMEPSVVVRSTPSATGTDLFVLHEGRKVTITDDSMAAWKEIELEDGNVGWIETESLERI